MWEWSFNITYDPPFPLKKDCTRAERPSANRRLEGFVDKSPLHCTYKFDQHAVDNIEASGREGEGIGIFWDYTNWHSPPQAQIHDIDSNAAAAEAEHHQFHGLL